MNQKEQIHIDSKTPSLLDRFALGFEYNKTIQQVKHETLIRTI